MHKSVYEHVFVLQMRMLDIQKIRSDFPILSTEVHGKPLVYLDNGATTQKPKVVLDTIAAFYLETNSSIHRGVHFLSNKVTESYEDARETVRQLLNAKAKSEIVFTSGTTHAINLVAGSYGSKFVQKGDEILVSEMEHHANIVPWQLLCEQKGAVLRPIPITDAGEIDVEAFKIMLSPKVKMVSVTHTSNVLGTVNPLKEMIALAHARDIPFMVDGAQAVQHDITDVQELDCDFLAFSGHKIYGPTGIGVLYGKENWLEQLPPYMGGGDMVDRVSFSGTTYNELPFKFEAGTTNYIGAIGLGQAIKYVQDVGLEAIGQREKELYNRAVSAFNTIEALQIYGTAPHKAAILSFLGKGMHFFDIGMVLDKMGISVRTGTHCAQPLMQRLGIEGTVRAVFSFYNTEEEVDCFVSAVQRAVNMFG